MHSAIYALAFSVVEASAEAELGRSVAVIALMEPSSSVLATTQTDVVATPALRHSR